MGMLLIVPKQSEMDDQLGAPSQHQKSFYIYEEECIFLVKCFMVYFFEQYVDSSLGTNTKILNFEHSEHSTFQTSHFGPKSNFEHVEHHKNPNSLRTSNCKFQD